MLTIEEAKARVTRGAAWLDGRYPNWWAKIDLGTLQLSNCNLCVLGQVWTGVAPEDEKDELIAQVVASSVYYADEAPRVDGFNMMMWVEEDDSLYLYDHVAPLGFDLPEVDPDLEPEGFDILTQAWTDLIISRRLDAQPETAKRIDDFPADPSTGIRIERGQRRVKVPA